MNDKGYSMIEIITVLVLTGIIALPLTTATITYYTNSLKNLEYTQARTDVNIAVMAATNKLRKGEQDIKVPDSVEIEVDEYDDGRWLVEVTHKKHENVKRMAYVNDESVQKEDD